MMCDECNRIDAMIEHYLKRVDPPMDRFTQGMVNAMVEDLKANKVMLHPEEAK
jgi:hypothetical protein